MNKILELFKNPTDPQKSSFQMLFLVIFMCGLILPSLAIIAVVGGSKTQSRASSPLTGFSEQLIAGSLTQATAMEFAPDGRLFVLEQNGNVRIIKNGALLSTPFLHFTDVNSCLERGVLGITFDPNFASNRFVYIYHTVNAPSVHNQITRVAASVANGDVADTSTSVNILDLDGLSSECNHNGGGVHFGRDGKLYVGVGENHNSANAQSVTNRLGKILRINSDGSIPADNPSSFVTSGGTKSPTGLNRAIYALGFRNPFTFDVNRVNGDVFVNDVGESTWEEIDKLQAGGNYGWGWGCEGNCSNSNTINPIHAYDHSSSNCAITGGTFYQPSVVQFPSSYVGQYLFADYCGGTIKSMNNDGSGVKTLTSLIGSPVDVKVGPDGALYYLARISNSGAVGQVYKILYNQTGHPTPDPTSTNIWCEGESANPLTAPLVKDGQSTYIYLNAASVTGTTTPPTNTGYAEYTFNVPVASKYNFWAKVNYPDTGSNSFWVGFDDNAPIDKFGNDNFFGAWHWINYTNGDTTPVNIAVNLSAGNHKVKLWGREQNAKLDRWILSTDSLFAPQDSYIGPVQNCAAAVVNPPTATIVTPPGGATFKSGDTISYSGAGKDSKGVDLPASAFRWDFELRHMTHGHPNVAPSVTGAKSGSIVANYAVTSREVSDQIFYRIHLFVTDPATSLTTETIRDVLPLKTTVTLGANPAGAIVRFNTDVNLGDAQSAPHQWVSVVNYPHVISVDSPQVVNGSNYNFGGWSDGGAIQHTINPAAGSPTYTATLGIVQPQTGVWHADYYNSRDLSGNVVATSDALPKINFNWPASPATGVNADNFSVRWKGQFDFNGGKYRLNATADDGVRVFIDGSAVNFVDRNLQRVESWRDQGATTYNSFVRPTAGVHNVVVEYYDSVGGALAQVNWVLADSCYDMTGDGLVDDVDLNIASNHFGALGDTPWNVVPVPVIPDRSQVNSADLLKIAQQKGRTCS